MSARQSPAAVQDMELGMVDHHSPYPEAYINPSTDPMSPPLIWRDSSASNNATLVNGQAPNNNYHARVDSYFSNGTFFLFSCCLFSHLANVDYYRKCR